MTHSTLWPRRLILLCVFLFNLTGCVTTLVSPREMALNDLYSLDEVDAAMRKAATGLNWTLVKNEGGFQGTLRLRDHEAVVQFNRDRAKISAVYKGSTNLGYDGTHIHKKYHSWIDKFYKAVRSNLGTK